MRESQDSRLLATKVLTAMSVFDTTGWSTVLLLGSEREEERASALAKLCEAYWRPVYLHARRKLGGHEDALDATQGFFADIIDRGSLALADPSRGRFRTFLLTLVDRFLINQWAHDQRTKRGGGIVHFSIDVSQEDAAAAVRAGVDDPARAFDRDWARHVMQRAKDRLRREYAKRNREALADALLPVVLDADGDSADLATRLGMSPGALRTATHRMRHRFGEAIRGVVRETVAQNADVEEEIRYLISASGGP